MENILVLGGNGYLGSKVVKALVQACDDNTARHQLYCTKRGKSDLSRLGNTENVNWVSCNNDKISEVLKSKHISVVLNMACTYEERSALYSNIIDSNLFFPLKTLDMAVQYGVQNFITIGTGLPNDLNMYSYSKKVLSDFGRFYVEKHDINFVNVKLEMLYGADEPQDRFIPSVIRKMLRGEDVNVTLGTQHRDIIAVEDIVYAIITILQADIKGYNEISVGTGVAPTISELIDYIWSKTEKKSVVNKGVIKMRNKEPDCVADIAKISMMCDWKPVYWQDGIADMIERIRKTEADR